MSKTKTEDMVWGVVHSGVLTFIGAFCAYCVEAPLGLASVDFRSKVIGNIKKGFELGQIMELSPVMELAAPLQQVRDGQRTGVAKSPLPMPYGFTTGGARLSVRPDAIAFIDEMTEVDQRLYRSFIKSVAEAETSERASRSGITLASNFGS